VIAPARGIGVAALASAFLVGPAATTALADGGCGAPGRPACTVLRPIPPTTSAPSPLGAGDCVLEVGGLGSTADETGRAFEDLVGDLDGVRVETLEYDTLGKIAVGADVLRDHARGLARSCAAVHILAHSMGGVVADRAFSKGLSAADGIATYVPLASPHNGATAARELCGIGEIDPGYAELLRQVAALLDLADPTAEAICDLARVTPARAPRGVASARLRLVTDPLVLRRDHVAPHRDVRELLPAGPAELEGHGGILRNAEARAIVRGSIEDRSVPIDERGPEHRLVAAIVSIEADHVAAATQGRIAELLWDGAIVARLGRLAREILEEIRSYVVLVGPTVFSYLATRGPATLPR
jgi:hypothetical protein